MTFEQRNEKWDGSPRFFIQNQTRASGPRLWRVEVKEDQIFTEWGQQGGKMQQVFEKSNGVNQGKKNEISPEDYALYLGREKCRKKHWEGYREIKLDGSFYDAHETKINFNQPPKNLAFWKPDNSPGAGILKKAAEKLVWYVRKMNGLMYCAWCTDAGTVFLTSRRMLTQHDDEVGSSFTWNDRFPHIVEALQATMPPRSLLLGELCAFDRTTNKDDLHLIESYTKSLTPRALEDQARNGWAWYYCWDVGFWDGVDMVSESPVEDRYELINGVFLDRGAPLIPPTVVKPDQYPGFGLPDDMRRLAKEWGWEGFVMVDPKGVFGDRAYNFKGKPDRPGKFAAKVKPEYEDDFIVFWNPEEGYGEYSTKGRYGDKGVKSVCLYQLNKKGELIYIANCASGLTEEMKSTIKPSKKPLGVWKILYTDRRYISAGDETNAIDFPRFEAVRADKAVEECVNSKL